MLTVLTCIGTRHNLWLVLLAAIICCVGIVAAMRLLRLAAQASWPINLAWANLAATVFGVTVWCTHFIAILGFNAGAPVSYDPVKTLQSLVIAIFGCIAGFSLATLKPRGAWPALAGGMIGLVISAMHYVGMLALRMDGIVRWQPGMVVTSVLLAMGLSSLAMAAASSQHGPRAERLAPALLVGAILILHFTGMAAIQVIPLAAAPQGTGAERPVLALATALAGALIIAVGTFIHMLERLARRDATAKMAALSAICEQTGFLKRPAFERKLAAILDDAAPGQQYMVATIKLWHFNDVVERHGLAAGDIAIRETADRMREAEKAGVLIGRTGRAEFAAIGPLPPKENTVARARQMRSVLAAPIAVKAAEVSLDPRMGFAIFPDDASTADEALYRSRLALGRAKTNPLEPVCGYDEAADKKVQRQRALADDLLPALERGEFEVYYQPQVWIAERRIIGCEALIRWNHPILGLVSPAEFIPLAEHTGAIVPIGLWVLQMACEEAVRWPADWRVAVNVSPLQLRQHDLPEQVLEALVNSGLSPARLEIELTESLLVDDRTRALHILRRIRALGVRLALDDFGTGYSSLDVLRHFPFDKIKLDRSFVQDIQTNPQSLAILHAMVEMGRSLDIPILVEGVETEKQLEILRAEGCRKVQGYLTGRPVPAHVIASNLTSEGETLVQTG